MTKAPFTDKDVLEFNKHQKSNLFHPYTCSRKPKECETKTTPRDFSKDGVLTATRDGLICPCGKFKQDWF